MSVCATVAFAERETDSSRGGERGRMLQPHYIQRTSALAASSRVTPVEQGEPDRNNTINQIRLSLKSLFPLGRKFASRG